MPKEQPTLIIRAKNRVEVCRFPEPRRKIVDHDRVVAISTDGQLLAVTTANAVQVFALPAATEVLPETFTPICQITEVPDARMLAFSSKGKYLVTGERYQDASHNNVRIWALTGDNTEVWSFGSKSLAKETWPLCQWTQNEEYMARMTSNEIVLHNGQDLSKICYRMRIDNIASFSLSPAQARGTYHITTFVPEIKGAPAQLSLYEVPRGDPPTTAVFVSDPKLVARKGMFKAQTIEVFWNAMGTSVIIKAQTDVDTTGKSYYGESNVVFLKTDGSSQLIDAGEGPVHAVGWSPTSKEFIVISGFMPARAILYDANCKARFDFGKNHRNTIRYSPNGKLLCLGGFGNLNGGVDFYEKKGEEFEKRGSAQADCSVISEWSPDGYHFLTSVCSPRMRVGNCYKLWKYDGTLVSTEVVDELFETIWQPVTMRPIPTSPKSSVRAVASAPVAEAPKAYCPPHRAGRTGFTSSFASSAMRVDKGPVKPQKMVDPEYANLPPGTDIEQYKKAQKKIKDREKKLKEKEEKKANPVPPVQQEQQQPKQQQQQQQPKQQQPKQQPKQQQQKEVEEQKEQPKKKTRK